MARRSRSDTGLTNWSRVFNSLPISSPTPWRGSMLRAPRRIARELHDGVNQDLAALSIALSAIADAPPDGPSIDRREQVARLQARAMELAEAIRHLSHNLHPGVLQYAGLATALRSHCREFERDHELTVTYHADENLGTIPSDVALCLYRVTQEALTNA